MCGASTDLLVWKKSTASGGGNCLEAANTRTSVLVRDSKNPQGGVLTFSRPEWAAFLVSVRDGKFDLRN